MDYARDYTKLNYYRRTPYVHCKGLTVDQISKHGCSRGRRAMRAIRRFKGPNEVHFVDYRMGA